MRSQRSHEHIVIRLVVLIIIMIVLHPKIASGALVIRFTSLCAVLAFPFKPPLPGPHLSAQNASSVFLSDIKRESVP